MKKINLNFNETMLNKIDEKAKEMSVTRTAYITFCVSQMFKADEMKKDLTDLQAMLNDLQKKYPNE